MSGVKSWVIGLAVIILFSYALFMFATQYILKNNPESDIRNVGGVNATINALNNSVNDISVASENLKNTYNKYDSPSLKFLFLISEGAFYIPFAIFSIMYSSILTFTNLLFLNVFGAASGAVAVVVNTILALTVIVAVIIAIRFIRTGSEGNQ
jgi:hypothetical protein